MHERVKHMINKMNFANESLPIANVLNSIKTVNFGGLDLRPTYQRGFVWKNDFKDKLIFSIINAYPIGNFSIRVLSEKNDKGAMMEVVDGQQRLTTIRDFVEGDYAITSDWSRKIIESIQDEYIKAGVEDEYVRKLCKKLENKGKVKIKYSDLPPVIQGNISTYNLAVTKISNASNEMIREYFRFLQNQERLRAGELINSMPATNLEAFLNNVENKSKFLASIGFADNRAEFDKIFYSIIGLFDQKIPFGSTDRMIQNYASKADTPDDGLEATKLMIEQINAITKTEKKYLDNTRKRFLKYLLLLAGLGFVDFSYDTEEKLWRLKEIDDKLSVFFSAKANAVDDTYKGYQPAVVEELRNIALLTKGGHPLSRVENRMAILAHYINSNNMTTTSNITLLEAETKNSTNI